MKDVLQIICGVLGMLILSLMVVLLIASLVHVSNGYFELKNFNKINNTTYTLSEWQIYQYDIKRLHPYKHSTGD